MAKGRKPSPVLDKPADKVIRHQAQRLLKKAGKAVDRLKDPDDGQALHDARVALRRLRGWFQAFPNELPLKRKHRHALRDLAHSTNDARDAEVGLEWLTVLQRRTRPTSTPDMAAFAVALKAKRDEGYRTARKGLLKHWHKLAHTLHDTAPDVDAPDSPFRRSFAASLRCYARAFQSARKRARGRPTPANLHALRITGKKLRYLVEVVLKSERSAKVFLGEMQALHDSAGAIQDLERLLTLSGPRRGIGDSVRREQVRRIAAFRKAYLRSQPPRCLRELHGLLQRLS